jgi:hypothetical protein
VEVGIGDAVRTVDFDSVVHSAAATPAVLNNA